MKHLIRSFRRSPGFYLVVIATLAVGIGANTAIFSVVRGILLRPLPYSSPEALVSVADRHAQSSFRGHVSVLELLDIGTQSKKIAALAAYSAGDANLTSDGTSQRVTVGFVTADFFSVLGVSPSNGRAFRAGEDAAGANHVVVLSHELWKERYASDPSLVGKSILVDNESYQVVGILPASYSFESHHDLYVPIVFSAEDRSEVARDRHFLTVVGRLAPGATLAQSNDELAVIGARLRADHPNVYPEESHWHPDAEPLLHTIVADVRPSLWLLAAAAGLVLLVVCGNVASLLLARASTRQRELSVRAALGASRGRLLRQLLGESVILSAIGGLFGLLIAVWGTDVLLSMAPESLPRTQEVRVDGLVLVFSVLLIAATGVLFGLYPAWSASRVDLGEALRASGRSASVGKRPRRVRRLLVVAETALALMLVTSAALVTRSFARVTHVDPGFRADGVLSLRTTLPANLDDEATRRWFVEATDRLAALPGVEHVGAIDLVPLSDGARDRLIDLEDAPTPAGRQRPDSQFRVVTPGYLDTMRVPLVSGRLLLRSDIASAPPVVVVTQAFARTFWPSGDALGHRFRLSSPRGPWTTIVGIVGDVRDVALDRVPEPTMFMPMAQVPAEASFGIMVRGNVPPAQLAGAVRAELERYDPKQPTYDVLPMPARLASAVDQRRFVLVLFELFAGLALGLAALGLYGLLAQAVAERRREIGVRVALGARGLDVAALVAREGALLLGVGVALGVVGGLGGARLLGHLLYEVSPTDPTALALAVVLLFAAAAVAMWLPLRRALRVDPMDALRDE